MNVPLNYIENCQNTTISVKDDFSKKTVFGFDLTTARH